MKDIEEKILDYVHGELSEVEKASFEQEIASNQEYQALLEEYKEMSSLLKEPTHQPDKEWKQEVIGQILKKEIAQKATRVVPFNALVKKITAAAAVLIIGYLAITNLKQQEFIEQVDNDLVALRSQIQNQLRNDNSVSQRIMAVNYSDQMMVEDESIIEILTHTLVNDESAHVRLVTVDALSRWLSSHQVQASLIKQLKVEVDPSVKIALIQSLSTAKNNEVEKEFESIIQNEATPKYIKDEVFKSQIRNQTPKQIL